MDEFYFNQQGAGRALPINPIQSKLETSPGGLPRSVSHGKEKGKRPKFERRRATSEDPGART